MAFQLIIPAFEEPYSLSEAKLAWRVTIDDDDALITSLITASREHAETVCHRQILTATYALVLDCFPHGSAIALPRPPLQSVTRVTYVDTAGVAQTLPSGAYGIDTASEPGRVYLNQGCVWPSVARQPNVVRIEFVAGYPSPEDVPRSLIVGMQLLAGHWYEQREAVADRLTTVVPLGVQCLFAQHRFTEAY
jgi:uncharacterized phiE125 gp8 family phage protein